jgi:hypothetical protein
MKKLTQVFTIILSLFFLTLDGQAYTITDNYWGADPTSGWSDRDVIGDSRYFEISKMEVTIGNSDGMRIDIYTTYLNNIGQYGTQLGDLFISTNGWSPVGTAPYINDNFYALNSEKWEYALVLDNHSPDTTNGQLAGTVSLYNIKDPSRIILSSAPSGYIYRAGQEVQFNAQGLNPVAAGTWSIGNWGIPDTDDYLRFAINYDFNAAAELGFHWGMTCANDVIEGGAPVPEPGTMLLLGSGLVGLIGFGRKKLLKKI